MFKSAAWPAFVGIGDEMTDNASTVPTPLTHDERMKIILAPWPVVGVQGCARDHSNRSRHPMRLIEPSMLPLPLVPTVYGEGKRRIR